MKRTILLIGVTISAMMLHAAQVKWSMTNITAPDDSSSLQVGAVAYFMDSSTYSNFIKLSLAEKWNYVKDNSTYSATTELYKGATRILENSGNYSAGTTISGYIVLFDASEVGKASAIAYTAVASTTAPAIEGSNAALSFGKFADAMSAEGSSGGWVSIPEPTSGLLILLGMAGLALRRKQK